VISATRAAQITDNSASLEASVNPGGAKTEYRFEYLTDAAYRANPEGERFAGALLASGSPSIPKGEEDIAVAVPIGGLSPATTYHFRAVVMHSKEVPNIGAERTFATYPTPAGLPDGRVYEQASPVDKDGGDVTGTPLTVKAARQGGGVTFLSTVGIPGGVGAQELPFYLASRGSDWSTQGLLPPPSFGQTVSVKGWRPDLSTFFEEATKFGEPKTTAFLERPGNGGPIVEIAPYTVKGRYDYAGSSADGSEVVFESPNDLATTSPGLSGHPNVYAWDAATHELSLVSVLNDKTPPKEGAFAGSYDWISDEGAQALQEGGASSLYYTQDEGAIAGDGAVVFTAAGSGQLYLRLNPTKQQSALSNAECTEAASRACTLHLSASEKSSPDLAGPRPAALMAATPDGSKVFFNSAEKLTDDATTGPEPGKAAIGRAEASKGDGGIKEAEFIPKAAAGMFVSGEHLYWADAKAGTIGRAKLNGTEAPSAIEDEFIKPGLIEISAGQKVPSRPQYVTAANGFVYWTDATDGKDGHGKIGRAKLGPSAAEEIEPEFIGGASNPQGIAANTSTVYWANAGGGNIANSKGIGAAESGGGGVNQRCIHPGFPTDIPEGLALDSEHLYWTLTKVQIEAENVFEDYVDRADLACEGEGKNLISRYVGQNYDVRGIALDSGHAYFVEQRKGQVGRIGLELSEASLEWGFLSAAGLLKGVAVDGEHLYFSANGETRPNPGNDLYRYEVAKGEVGQSALSDITVDEDHEKDPNGAEVKGVLGISEDGSRVYFAANGVLATGAARGNCEGALGLSGECNLYIWEDDGSPKGKIAFIARLDVNSGGSGERTDAANWTGTPRGVFFGDSNFRKTSWASADGATLLFRSQRRLSDYDNEGVPELYLYRLGEGISCVSCNPTGTPPGGFPTLGLGSINPSSSTPANPAALASRNFAAEGKRVFFESTEALVEGDTNGAGGCPTAGSRGQTFPRCLDVYEWEAPGEGSCEVAGSAYSPQNAGCLYLLSSGKSNWPSFFIDASESGKDAFFFTREGLVGQDKDELLDVYDARAGGGIPSQTPSPPPPVCEGSEACHGPAGAPPAEQSAGSASFAGPANPKPKRGRAKHKGKGQRKHHANKHHAKGRVSR